MAVIWHFSRVLYRPVDGQNCRVHCEGGIEVIIKTVDFRQRNGQTDLRGGVTGLLCDAQLAMSKEWRG